MRCINCGKEIYESCFGTIKHVHNNSISCGKNELKVATKQPSLLEECLDFIKGASRHHTDGKSWIPCPQALSTEKGIVVLKLMRKRGLLY